MRPVRFMLVDGTKHEVQIPSNAAVEALAQKVAYQLRTDSSNIRLLLRGTVLKDPMQLLSQTQFKASDILICNVLCPPTVRPAQKPTSDWGFEEKVAKLVEMGFLEPPSREALRRHNGSIEAAVRALMPAKS
jgi:hypothetical protein